MFTIATYEYECTKKCKIHGNRVTAAVTKRSVTSEDLAAYIAKLCRNFAEIVDDEGRSALAMAVSVGNRCDLLAWLVQNGANINLKDRESGHTPLVRAIYYGNIAEAVMLQIRGATLVPDNDFVNPLQYCCRVKKPIEHENRCETFVWGKNKNYNLGIGNVQGKEVPEYLETFRKGRIWIEQVSMNSYHSLFLSDDGDVYATGHGKGGRLGSGDELTLVTPRKISIPTREDNEKIIYVSAGKNHSLVLSNKNRVYATGSNIFYQLGLKSGAPDMVLSFVEVPVNFWEANKVIATEYTSFVVTASDVYAFGTNLGQLGLKKELEKVVTPRKLPFNHERQQIELVQSSNTALVCYTEQRTCLLYICYKYETKIYKKPLMERIVALSVNGGSVPEGTKGVPKCDKQLRIVVLTELRNIFIWYESIEKFVRCSIEASRFLEVDKVIWCNDDLLVSFLGNLYRGTTQEVKFKATATTSAGEYQETYVKKELSNDQRVKIKLKRIPYTDKVVDFCSDPEGENFALILENPRKYFSLPDLIEKTYNFSNLLAEVDEYDAIHDLVLEIGGRRFASHRIIVFSRCEYLKKVVQSDGDKKKVVLKELQNLGLSADLFELILRFLYTNNPIMKNEIERFTVDYHQTLTMLKKVLTVMGLPELITSLKKNSEKCGKPFESIQRAEYPELFDVTIKLDGNKEIRGHKCVLMSRLEYFNMMFTHSWTETDTVTLSTVSFDYMLPIIEFLYSNNIEEVRSGNYSENYLFNMITVCDQFFVTDLKQIFELIASERLSVRNCGDILEFAHTYNCETLQNCCMQYISLNLARILEHRSLESTDLEALKPINKFYRQFFGLEAYRTITPYSCAVSDEELKEFIRDFRVDLNAETAQAAEEAAKKRAVTKSKPSRTSLDKRNYEKEGILSIKDMTFDATDRTTMDVKRLELEREAIEVAEKLDNEAKTWLKVTEKKDSTKKKTALAGIRANETLKSEPKASFEFVPLKPPSPQAPPPKTPEEPAERKVSSFSLADFAVTKRSQKSRKRTTSSSTWDQFSPPPAAATTTPATPSPVNPWNTLPVVEVLKSPFEESSSSGSGGQKRPGQQRPGSSRSISFEVAATSSSSNAAAKVETTNSFRTIVEDEKKHKKYMEKIKTKSLVLTQIEEKAIEELQVFYNVTATFDESITVERKRYGDGVKFTSTWYN